MGEKTNRWQLWHDNGQSRKYIDHEICEVVMRVVCANQEQDDRDREQELFCRRVLVSAVDLLPQVQIVIRTSVELEWNTSHPVEH